MMQMTKIVLSYQSFHCHPCESRDPGLNNYVRDGRTQQKGFTLVEVLLGVTLFAVVSVSAYSAFWQGMRIARRYTTDNERAARIYQVLTTVSFELQNMVPYSFAQSYPELRACRGESPSLLFLKPSQTGLLVVRYFLASSADAALCKSSAGEEDTAYCLLRQTQPFGDYVRDAFGSSSDTRLVLGKLPATGIAFSYGSITPGTTEPGWQATWNETFLPSHVRVVVTRPNTGTDMPEGIEKIIFIPHGSQALIANEKAVR